MKMRKKPALTPSEWARIWDAMPLKWRRWMGDAVDGTVTMIDLFSSRREHQLTIIFAPPILAEALTRVVEEQACGGHPPE